MKRVASAVAVAVGRGVERALTGRAALGYYRTLLANTTDPEGRAHAILAALRVAMGLEDRAALAELAASWAMIPRGFWCSEIVGFCKELVNAGLTVEATALAGAEVTRHPTAVSVYLWARCSEGTDDASGRYALAIGRAEREGAREIVDAARRRRVVLLAGRWETMPEALREAMANCRRESSSASSEAAPSSHCLAAMCSVVRAAATARSAPTARFLAETSAASASSMSCTPASTTAMPLATASR